MADNFPISTWDGVNSPWQNIQNWRVYGPSGSGTSNTGFRNYGATGVNTSSGVGTAQTWFREGTPVQRTQYRAPSAGVQQRFTGDAIRPNTPPSMAKGFKDLLDTGSAMFSDPDLVASLPQNKLTRGLNRFFNGPAPKAVEEETVEPERVVNDDPIVLARQQRAREGREAREAGTFQPEVRPVVPMTKPSFTPDIPQYTREERQQMRTEQRQRLGQPPIQPPTSPEPFTPTPQQQKTNEGIAAIRAGRLPEVAPRTPAVRRSFEPDRPQYTREEREQMAAEQRQKLGLPPRAPVAKSPAAETPSTSRLSKRQQQRARADAAFASLRTGQAMESTGAAGIWSNRTW